MLTESNTPVSEQPQVAQGMPLGAKIAMGVGAVVIVALVIALVMLFNNLRDTQNDLAESQENLAATEEMMQFEKEQLADEYSDLANQYDGLTSTQQNDSLHQQLAKEQQHVRELLQELKNTKATDAKRIAELKSELASVRAVMAELVRQIDKLQQENANLTAENQTIKNANAALTTERDQLTTERDELTEKVTRAAMMEVGNFSYQLLNSKGKEAKRAAQVAKIQLDVSVLKNVTATPGEKTIYMQIRRPDGDVMTKGSGTFNYEGRMQPYSLSKTFEYTGGNTPLTFYWNVQDEPQKGTYHVDFFIEKARVGTFSFKIEK